jgi:phosphatidylserine/phosphatidylglycerophosphate/cardiolipin synthase-like enzyme
VDGLEVIVGGWFRSDSKWLVWKWLLVDGLEVIVGGWFRSDSKWLV